MWSIPDAPRWMPLSLSAGAGPALMIAAVVPLAMMPGMPNTPSARPRAPWRSIAHALRRSGLSSPADFCLLVLHRQWRNRGGAGGLSAAFSCYSPTPPDRCCKVYCEGQFGIAPWMGRLVDLWGNRPVMVLSRSSSHRPAILSVGHADQPWFVAGGLFVWIAYSGLNVGLDNIKLRLAPADNNAPFVAVYHAVSDLANGVAIVMRRRGG